MENITEYIAHAQTVCTRPLLGGVGPGDEARYTTARQCQCPLVVALWLAAEK